MFFDPQALTGMPSEASRSMARSMMGVGHDHWAYTCRTGGGGGCKPKRKQREHWQGLGEGHDHWGVHLQGETWQDEVQRACRSSCSPAVPRMKHARRSHKQPCLEEAGDEDGGHAPRVQLADVGHQDGPAGGRTSQPGV